MKRLFQNIIILTFAVACSQLSAQEVLTGLTINKNIHQKASFPLQEPSRTAIHLPFLDDFSNYTGFPNPALWQDRSAYVNRTFALRPPTLGIATLDALNENGEIYRTASSDVFEADALTSLPIRLDYNFSLNREMRLTDSIHLSFYYQPAGGTCSGLEWERVGNRPEEQDSLILEFGYSTGNIVFTGYDYCDYFLGEDETYFIGDTLWNPFLNGLYYVFENAAFPGDVVSIPCDSLWGEEMIWEHIWSTPGVTLDDWLAESENQFFKQVIIPIRDTRWLINNFQFRFRNLASLEDNGIVGWASNVDQWHIDYVKMDINRSMGDIYHSDVAFSMPTTSILQTYQAMPWSQYRDSELGDHFDNTLINLSNNVKNCNYSYDISKVGAGQVAAYASNNENANPYLQSGLHSIPVHAHPAYNFSSLPTDNADSATFVITHIFQETGNGSQLRSNDTCIYYQKFSNFFAYDDGSAEAGYSILSTVTYPEVYFAMRFTLNQPDTLRAVQMWFNSVQEDANVAPFTLMVWNDVDGEPGDVLYEMESQLPRHAERYEDFVNYYLDDAVAIDGTFYVGFYQDHSTQLNLGFDQNTDSRRYWLYKTGAQWNTPFLKGTPMIRAVVGAPIDHTSIAEVGDFTCNMYPNPVKNQLNVDFQGTANPTFYRIFDAFGRLVAQNHVDSNSITVPVSTLSPGIYVIQLSNNHTIIYSDKFVKF